LCASQRVSTGIELKKDWVPAFWRRGSYNGKASCDDGLALPNAGGYVIGKHLAAGEFLKVEIQAA
jgi:hypothetical protein